MRKAFKALLIVLFSLPLLAGSTQTIPSCGRVSFVSVATKAELEAEASSPEIDNKVIVVTSEISASAYTGLTSNTRADAHDDLDADTMVDIDVDFDTLCDNAQCDGKFLCIIDGPNSVSPTPEGECREIASTTADHAELTSAFSRVIINGTYYAVIDPIKLAPSFGAEEGDRITLECGEGGKLSAGGPGAPVILQISGENLTAPTDSTLVGGNTITIRDCEFEGTGDADAYDIAIFMSNYAARNNLAHNFINIQTTRMSTRNPDPQTARTGGTSFYVEDDTMVSTQSYYFSHASLAAQIPMFMPSLTERVQMTESILVDSDQVDRYRDQCIYASNGKWALTSTGMEYCSFIQFVKVSGHPSPVNFSWNGGWWIYPEGGAAGWKRTDTALVNSSATGGSPTTLIDATKNGVYADNVMKDRWVLLRPAGVDYEWRKIISQTGSPFVLTISSGATDWDSTPLASDVYRIYEPWHKKALFQTDDSLALDVNISIEGQVSNGEDPVRYPPFVFFDSIISAPPSTVSGRISNYNCGLTGDPGKESAADYVLIDASMDNTAPLVGVDLTVVNGYGTFQADAACNPIIPFGRNVDFAAYSKGQVTADGKTYYVDAKMTGVDVVSGTAPGVALIDSDTSDKDVGARVYSACTKTASATEDCDVTIEQQEAGNPKNVLFADADAGIIIGSANNNLFTVTTDGTGDGEVVLPAKSIGVGEITKAGRSSFNICGDATTVNNNTVYYGPSIVLLGNTSGGQTCDIDAAGSSSDEGSVDEVVYTSQDVQVLGMTCRNEGDANADISFTLRTNAGATVPSVSCTIADNARDCVAGVQTTTDLAANQPVAVAVTSTGDIGDGNGFVCEVEVAF